MSHDVGGSPGGGRGQARMTADEALVRLMEGHSRFLQGRPRFNALEELSKGQQPYATILGGSDSLVPPEVIFDAAPGELFVIRVAGNGPSAEVMGSLQYAGSHLKIPLFVVLGHDGCGAVAAALESRLHGVEHLSRIQVLADSIQPALERVGPRLEPEQQLEAAVEANVRRTMQAMLESPEGQARVREGVLKLVGAIYDLTSGRVRLLDQR